LRGGEVHVVNDLRGCLFFKLERLVLDNLVEGDRARL
jgi:hypothetical protein